MELREQDDFESSAVFHGVAVKVSNDCILGDIDNSGGIGGPPPLIPA